MTWNPFKLRRRVRDLCDKLAELEAVCDHLRRRHQPTLREVGETFRVDDVMGAVKDEALRCLAPKLRDEVMLQLGRLDMPDPGRARPEACLTVAAESLDSRVRVYHCDLEIKNMATRFVVHGGL